MQVASRSVKYARWGEAMDQRIKRHSRPGAQSASLASIDRPTKRAALIVVQASTEPLKVNRPKQMAAIISALLENMGMSREQHLKPTVVRTSAAQANGQNRLA